MSIHDMLIQKRPNFDELFDIFLYFIFIFINLLVELIIHVAHASHQQIQLNLFKDFFLF